MESLYRVVKSFAECEILSEWKFGRNKNSKQGIVCHKSTIFVKLYATCKGTPLEPRWANKKKKVERADAEDTRKNKTPLMKNFRGGSCYFNFEISNSFRGDSEKICTRVLGKFFPNKDSTVGVKSLICTTLCHACCFCSAHFLGRVNFITLAWDIFSEGYLVWVCQTSRKKLCGGWTSKEKSVWAGIRILFVFGGVASHRKCRILMHFLPARKDTPPFRTGKFFCREMLSPEKNKMNFQWHFTL